jgi:hypothetical protein
MLKTYSNVQGKDIFHCSMVPGTAADNANTRTVPMVKLDYFLRDPPFPRPALAGPPGCRARAIRLLERPAQSRRAGSRRLRCWRLAQQPRQRRHARRRPGGEFEVPQDAFDHLALQDRRDDAQVAPAPRALRQLALKTRPPAVRPTPASPRTPADRRECPSRASPAA